MKSFIKNKLYVFLFIAAFFGACDTKQSNKSESSSEKFETTNSKIQSVEVVNPELRSFTGELLITGIALPNKKVMLYAMESGYVQRIQKDIGEFVQKGQAIATLKNPELSRELEMKQAHFDSKESVYNRLKNTFEKTPALIPLQMVEEAKSEYLSALASLNSIKDRLSFLTIKAPFSGVITKRFIDPGALIQSGLTQSSPQAVVEIQDISTIRLTLPVPESDIVSVNKGTEVNITFPELPGESFVSKVSRTSGSLDIESKTMQVEIDLKNSNSKLKPGMYAKALVKMGSKENVFSLPVTAQFIQQNQAFLLIVNKDDMVERFELRKGLSNKEYFEVLNADLNKDAKVIVAGKSLVKEGQVVNPVLKSQ